MRAGIFTRLFIFAFAPSLSAGIAFELYFLFFFEVRRIAVFVGNYAALHTDYLLKEIAREVVVVADRTGMLLLGFLFRLDFLLSFFKFALHSEIIYILSN